MEEEVGGIQSLAKEDLGPQKPEEARKDSLLDHLEGVCSC